MRGAGEPSGLLGRRSECERLDGLVAAAEAGRSQVLVLRGEAGIGKTALVEYLVARAPGFRVARATGVEAETELAYAGLHQLCSPYLARLEALPGSQRDALATAFRLRSGPAPDRVLVGSAVLSLLSEVAQERPLLCVVDDAQWLDQASAATLEFVGRRLEAGAVVLVLAVRGSAQDPWPAGLPDLVVRGLGDADAAVLLDSSVPFAVEPPVRNRILAESAGNPLALLELPRGLPAAELVFGGVDDTHAPPLVERLEGSFLRQVSPLPEQSRRLLLLASAEPTGDVRVLGRAARLLGLGPEAGIAAQAAGLVELGNRVRFRHPLARSAVYRSAPPSQRRAVHRALADVTDAETDPDRRAWHHAHAAVGPDEELAAELETSAGRALGRAGVAAAAAFLDRAAALTPDPVRRVRRSLDAAQAKIYAGAFGEASQVITAASRGPLAEVERARIDLLRAQLPVAANRGDEALPLLLAAADRLRPLDAGLSRDAYLDALSAALSAGRLGAGPGARRVAEAAREAPAPHVPCQGDALLEALTVLLTEGYPPAVAPSRRAVEAFAHEDLGVHQGLRFSRLAACTAVSLWDDAGWDAITRRHLDAARRAGALGAIPPALTGRVLVHLFTGDLPAAASLVDEIRSLGDATGGVAAVAPIGEVCLAAVRGDGERAEPLIRSTLDDLTCRGEGAGVTTLQWARAVLYNGLGRYGEALVAAQDAAGDPVELGPRQWALAELVEAGARGGATDAATSALADLSALAHASGTPWALGIEAGRRALLRQGDNADALYREAIERLGRTSVRVDLARTQLLYGEWLRREGRRVDARTQLRTAYEALRAMGAGAFAERARRELAATGETVRRRLSGTTTGELTAQEAHIARLVAEGLTNPEIAAALFISPRTVEWHLRKVFTKLGIGTRRELRRSRLRPDPSTQGA